MPIILKKGEETALVNDKGMPVLNLTVGANWGKINRLGTAPKAGFLDKLLGIAGKATGQLEDVDLDLSLLFFNSNRDFLEKCYFGNKTLFSGAVSHTGDDLTGDDEVDELDNERIKFKGAVIPMQVQTVFVVLNSYRHQNFGEIPFVGFSIYDGLYGLGDKAPRLADFRLDNDKSFAGSEAAVMARIDRTPKGWVVTPIALPTKDRSIVELQATCRGLL